jgi:hypothetical protein
VAEENAVYAVLYIGRNSRSLVAEGVDLGDGPDQNRREYEQRLLTVSVSSD